VAANDAKGLRIADQISRSVKVIDADYKDAIQWLEFAADGRLVTTSLDGGVRLYDATLARTAVYKAPAGLKPYAATFNRDGSAIAVGMLNAPTVVVLSGSDLARRAEHKGGANRKGALSLVAWAADGSLLAAGTYGDAAGRKLIRKWTLGGDVEIPVGGDTVTGLVAQKDGSLIFASGEPSWGLIGADGKTAFRVGSRQADFRDGHDSGFKVSADGSAVEFGFAQGGKQRARFDVSAGTLERRPIERDNLKPATTAGGGISWTDWRNGDKPKLNGKVVALDANEKARSAAVQGTSAVLGTDFFLRAYRAGQMAWRTQVPAPVWTVNVSGDGRLAVAGLGDGTIRWFRVSDGVEVLSLFAEPDGERWVLWSPEGFFDHGPGGESLIGYHLNQVDQTRPKGSVFVKVEQLYALFFRRDLVVKKFRGDDEKEIAAQLAKVGDIRTVLGRGLPPEIKLTEYCIRGNGAEQCQQVAQENQLRGTGGKIQPIPVAAPEVVLRFEVQDRGGGVGPIVVRRQGAPVPAEGTTRSATGGLRNEERVVPLSPGLNLLGLSVFNSAKEIETDPKARPGLVLRYQAPVVEKPVLRLLAIGIDAYRSKAIPALTNAAADAKGVAEAMHADNKREVFTEVDSIVLTNEQATLANILKAFDDLTARAKPADLALVFLAGHGVDLDGKYYFLPNDLPDLGSDTIRGKALTHEELAARLGKFPMSRTVVVLDTCYSGAFAIDDSILKDSRDQTVGKQISHASGRFILAGSANQEEALDGVDGHGVFTGVLLRGLSGDADKQAAGNKDGKISILELGEFTKSQVPVLAAKVGNGHSQKPRWFFNGDDMFNVRDSN
jgi:WD40 repeat protein